MTPISLHSIGSRRRHSRALSASALPALAPALACALTLILLSGCAKRVTLGTSGVDIADGRVFEIEFQGDRSLRGKLTRGSTVRYVQGDSLFEAEVDAVTDEFIELSRRELVTDLDEWTPLQRAAADSRRVAERPELGGALLSRDEIETIAVVIVDRRRTVLEALFWTAAAVTAGFAASAR